MEPHHRVEPEPKKAMLLRQLLLRSDVQHKNKTCFKTTPRVLRPHHFYAAPGSDFGLKFLCGSAALEKIGKFTVLVCKRKVESKKLKKF
jgi:hypothetical protein